MSNLVLWRQVIPSWLTAIGTISAVILALYLSIKDKTIKYTSKANFIQIICDGVVVRELFQIKIINESYLPINLHSIIIKPKRFKSKYELLLLPIEQILPKNIEPFSFCELWFENDVILKELAGRITSGFTLYFTTLSNKYYKITIDKEAKRDIIKAICAAKDKIIKTTENII